MEKYDDEFLEEEVDENESSEFNMISFLSVASIWFIRFGMVVAVILLIYFIVVGKIGTAFLYILGLVVAYFFGYGFMFCLDKFIESNNEDNIEE